jgi:hypothetical protein
MWSFPRNRTNTETQIQSSASFPTNSDMCQVRVHILRLDGVSFNDPEGFSYVTS